MSIPTTLSATVIVRRDDQSVEASHRAMRELRALAARERKAFAGGTFDLALDHDLPGLKPGQVALIASAPVVPLGEAMGGCDGVMGPFSPANGNTPHVYAREVHSGAGNCVCGAGLGDWIHTEAAAGVPIPAEMRR